MQCVINRRDCRSDPVGLLPHKGLYACFEVQLDFNDCIDVQLITGVLTL